MDDDNDLPEVQRGESDGSDFHPSTSENGDLTLEDLRILRFESLEHAEQLLRRYRTLDIIKMPEELFKHHLLLRRDAWFVEAGDRGLIFFTEVAPEFNAYLNIAFWDKVLDADRRMIIQATIKEAFERFSLRRVSLLVAADNQRLLKAAKQMGFCGEGVIREGNPDGADLHMFGMLREEIPWHVRPMRTSISA
jgi:hypothetical protein